MLRRIVADARRGRARVQMRHRRRRWFPKVRLTKVFITTAGSGLSARVQLGGFGPGRGPILVSGPIADHGMAVMLARGDLNILPIEATPNR